MTAPTLELVTDHEPNDAGVATRLAPHAFEASTLMRTLGHSGRLMVLCHLYDGARTVGELQELVGATQPVVSSHLARLRHEGLVRFERVGKTNHYELADDRVRAVVSLLNSAFCPGLAPHLAK